MKEQSVREQIERLSVELSKKQYTHLEIISIEDHEKETAELRYDTNADTTELFALLTTAMALYPDFETAVLNAAVKWVSGDVKEVINELNDGLDKIAAG